MTNDQLDKLLKLAQLAEIHGKMGGTRPFDRLLAPIARELRELADELEKDEKAKVQAEKEQAEAAQQAQIDEANRQNEEQTDRHLSTVDPDGGASRTAPLNVEQEHIDVTRRI